MNVLNPMPRYSSESDLARVEKGLLINGVWKQARGGTFTKRNPANEQPIAEIASATADDIDEAVRAARAQFEGDWSRLSAPERGRLLWKLADLIERDGELIARLQALEGGQPVIQPTLLDVPMTVGTFRYFAGWADKIEGKVIPTPGYQGRSTHSYTVREPLGVIGAIIPWNTPIMIASWKLAPALACGCTVVVKPSEDAMLTIHYLGQLAKEAGFPDGVINIVSGLGEIAGAALVRHPDVDKVSFTGSPEVGRLIQKQSAETFKRTTLELGGKSPQIVLGDADFDNAVQGISTGLFWHQGQICAAGTRILVQRARYYDMVDALADAARKVKLGDPFDSETTMGALINANQRERVLRYIRQGSSEGATLVTGGGQPRQNGYFVEPTIFAGSNGMKIACEEIFGPVGTVMPFDSVEEAIQLANDTTYGLAATIWTRDISHAHLLARQVKAGAVSVNGWAPIDPRLPWGGMKQSGVGRELGWAGIEDNTEEKVITVVL